MRSGTAMKMRPADLTGQVAAGEYIRDGFLHCQTHCRRPVRVSSE